MPESPRLTLNLFRKSSLSPSSPACSPGSSPDLSANILPRFVTAPRYNESPNTTPGSSPDLSGTFPRFVSTFKRGDSVASSPPTSPRIASAVPKRLSVSFTGDKHRKPSVAEFHGDLKVEQTRKSRRKFWMKALIFSTLFLVGLLSGIAIGHWGVPYITQGYSTVVATTTDHVLDSTSLDSTLDLSAKARGGFADSNSSRSARVSRASSKNSAVNTAPAARMVAQSIKPTSQSTKSTSQSIKSTSQYIKPTSQYIKPTSQSTKSTSQSIKPTSQSIKPTSQSIKPTSQSTKPTSQSTKPTSQSTKPTSQSTKSTSQSTTSAQVATSTSATAQSTTPAKSFWKPATGATIQVQIGAALTSTSNLPSTISIYDVDLFDTSIEIITGLKNAGKKVICYFSAGTAEDWRSDYSKFMLADLGRDMVDWAGEKWLHTPNANVRKIMLARLELAKSKGCDGVDPDNVDVYGFGNSSGFTDLTQRSTIDYLIYLADQAHALGLAIGLKNGGEITPQIEPYLQWALTEQCADYNECHVYKPFIDAGKPVFNIQYPFGDNNKDTLVTEDMKTNFCTPKSNIPGTTTILKHMNLDTWLYQC